MTYLQLTRHVSHCRRPPPSRASLWLAAVGLGAFALASFLFAVEMGWFGT